MDKKFREFVGVTKILNMKGITPVLYGSLGLYQIIDPLGPIDDIDFLISDTWLTDKWPEFKTYLEENGFRMDDEHEHEFSHPDIKGWIAFGSIEESKKHSGLDKNDLELKESNGAEYLVLNADQYLSAYKASLEDGYRQERKGDADKVKIRAIESHLTSHPENQ